MRFSAYIKRFFSLSLLSQKAKMLLRSRRRRCRLPLFEALEARQMFAAAIWHNVLQPLNVSGETGGSVDPLDVLTIINEINSPKFSNPTNGSLPLELPDGTQNPYLDIDCDSRVTPLDVLNVINAINSGVYEPDWVFSGSHPTGPTHGRVVASGCSPKLVEGDSLFTDLSQTIVIPDDSSAVRVSFETPIFDTLSRNAMRDAFEILLLDKTGQPLVLPFGVDRDASYNWSESENPIAGIGSQNTTSPQGSISTATFNVAGLAAGTKVQVKTRLVNNDSDINTGVVIRRVEIIDSQTPAPTGMPIPASNRPTRTPIDPNLLVDVTSSVQLTFGRTTLVDGNDVLVTDLQIKNVNSSAISGRMLLVVENLSDTQLSLLQPDGYLSLGKPFFILNANGSDAWIATGQSTASQELRFKNPNKQQFQYSLKVLAEVNSAPTGFTSSPLREIQAGKTYETTVKAIDPDGQTLVYSKVVGPAAMSIDSATGKIRWLTTAGDIGNQSVVIRATDPFGLAVDQAFTISVLENVQNRPPIFTSTPLTDATVARPFEVLTYQTGLSPNAAAAGDFGTGKLSIITANPGDQQLSLINGTGNEKFGSTQRLSVGEIHPSKFSTPFITGASVDLGFVPNTYTNNERNVLSVINADVNGDGYLDFAVAIDTNGSDFGPNDIGSVGVRLGNGDGTFRQGWQIQLPAATLGGSGVSSRADSIRFGDVNGDGWLDLVVVQSLGSKALVYAGNGDGTFENIPIESSVNEPYTYSFSSQLGDMNNDGKLDLVSYEYQRDGRFRTGTHVRLGDGTGKFANGTFYANANNNSVDGYLADVNGDGKLDTVRLNYSDSRIETRLNDGSGLLGDLKFSGTFYVVGNTRGQNSNPTSGYVADYNRDGKTDIVVSTAVHNFLLLTGNGDGTFGDATQQGNRLIAVYPGVYYNTPLQYFPGAGRNDGKAPDLNADGIPDFVFGNQQVDQLTTAVNDGTGKFTTHVYQSGFSDDIGNGSVRGQNPTPFIVAGDFNNDGIGDVLLGRDQSNNSTVRVGGVGITLGGNEPGSLRLPEVEFSGDEDLQVGNGNQVLADFDNDGILDIASNIRSGVAIAKGRADGSFETYTTGFNQFGVFSTDSLVASDFDRDGNMDIAYFASFNTPGSSPSFTILYGLGNGTFQRAAAPIPSAGLIGSGTISQQYGVAADVNGDGYPDVVYRFANNYSNFATAKSLVVYLYDPATRNLKLVTDRDNLLVTPHRGGFSQDEVVAFEDLNGDGKKELIAHSGAIGQNGITTTPERLTIWQPTNNAAATDASDLFTRIEFQNPGISPGLGAEGSINALLVADYNHDGKPDIAVSSQNGTSTVLFGNGDFTFRSPVTYNTNQSTGLRTADVNGDGNLDLIPIWGGFFNYNDLNNTGVLLGRSDGSFGAYDGLTTSGVELNSPLTGDFNQDGRDDINYGNYFASRLTVLAASPGLASVATGDINGDGKLDAVALDTGFARLKILLGNGDDTFTRQKDLFTGLQPESLLLQDINGDGKLDILTTNRVSKSISLFTNNGAGSFTRTDLNLTSQPDRMAVGDLNGDGKLDIAAISEKSQSLSILRNTASGFAPATEQPIGFAAADVVFADLTLDGKMDVILSDPNGKRIMTLPGQGNGTFGVPIIQPLQQTPDKMVVTDLNADGKPDIIATFPTQNQVGVLFGRGTGRLTTPQLIGVGQKPASISVKDINGDSKPDLLVANQRDNTLSVIINRYDPSSVYRYTPTATDPDADPVSFDLLNAPGGALYDEATQTIVWAPMPDQVGANAMVVRASDGRGGFAEQGFSVSVTAPVATVSPSFTSEPIVDLSGDQAYAYQPRISNPSNGPVRFSLIDGPEGATIDATTGVVNWDPRENGLSLGVRGGNNFPNNFENRANITIPSNESINAESFTAEGWYKFDRTNGILFGKEHSGIVFSNDKYYSWRLYVEAGLLRAEINSFSSTPEQRLDTVRLSQNTWYHLALTYDDPTRTMTIYVNGKSVGSIVSPVSPSLTDLPLTVKGLVGSVSEMRLWNRSRSASEINLDMVTDFPSDATGLVLNYHFQEGPAGTKTQDATSNSNHGFLEVNGEYSRYNFPVRFPAIAPSLNSSFTIRVDDGKGGSATQSFSVKTLPPLPKSIQGTVFDDVNGNGIKEGVNEPGLSGQVVFVDQNGNHELDPIEAQATTDASGNYSLSYVGTKANVVLVSKSGRVQSSPILPSQFVDLANGNASGVNFGTKSAIDGNPVFISVAPTTATVPGEFRYQAYAQSTDGSPIQYAIAVAPNGASIDTMSGLLKWTPKFADAGTVDVILKATDGAGRVVLQAFRLVVGINTAPFITSTAPSNASQGILFHYDVQAQDAEQSALTFAFEQAPAGATIDAASGKIRWTPSPSQVGSQSIIVVVNDGKGQQAKQPFNVNVTLPLANRSPILSEAPRSSAQVGVTYRSSVVATDADNDLLSYTLISGPTNVSITSDGLISWVPKELGPQSIRVQVADNRGGTDQRTYTVDVGSLPVKGSIQFTSKPVLNAVTERAYTYVAIAPGAKQYQLLTAPIGMSIDPVLGRVRWKPSVEQLGLTTIRIQAIDELGNTADQFFSINVRRSDALPSVTSVPPTQSTVGSTYVYLVLADNPSGNPLVYSLSVAPLGMSISAQTGAVSWTPTASQVGAQVVLLRVTDGAGNFLTQSFAIQVTASSPNRQPIATSTPPQDATADSPLAYRFTAVDPEGDNLLYSVVSGPNGLSIDPATGVLSWTPTTTQIGTVAITLKASDSLGAAAVQSFLVDVRGANRAPSIGSIAPQSVSQGGLYRYDVIATDPDRELLFYELTTAPQGMTIDSFGRIRLQTALDTPLGQRSASVRVFDGRGGSVVQNFSLNVVADTTAPKISILTSSMVLSPYNLGPSVVKVQAVDDVAVTSLQLFVDGQAVSLRNDGTADVYFTGAGNGKLLAYAFDPAGNRGSTTNKILMCSGLEECIPSGTANQPQTDITNIHDGDSVTGFVEVIGTAASADFESYELSYRRSDQTAFTKISSSTNSLTNGLLGKWDTTLLENDSYVLQLEARDKFGGFSAIEREVGVSGNLKLGNFRLSFTDLTIPVAGIPITISRTYDTLRADRSGDFGYGWRMEYRNTDLRTSLPKTGLEDQGIFTAFKPNTKVYLTLPGGQREGFTFTPDIRVLPGYGSNLVIATPRFTPDRGVKNKLSAGSGNLLVNERGELYASGGVPWNPSSPDFSGYTLTTPDGIQYKIDGSGKLTAAIDRKGNTLTFGEDAVVSQSENIRITMTRDARGRIRSITDPLGKTISYDYSPAGDLVGVKDRESNATKFSYRVDRAHYLDTIIDPLGRTGVRNEYDTSGRLRAIINADGKRIEASYDPSSQLETITDPLGHITITEYDSQGNIVRVTDPVGAVTQFEFDANNTLIRKIDALGRATRMNNDGFGFKTSETDARGYTTHWTYGRFGDETSKTDPLGNVTRSDFDSSGNLIVHTDANGSNATLQYSREGMLQNATAIDGVSFAISNDRGNPSTLSTNGRRPIAIDYDAAGRPIAIRFRSDFSNAETEDIFRLELDANGRRVREIDGEGGVTQSFYDAAGNRIRRVDPFGRVTRQEYDFANRLVKTVFPDATEELQAYDAAGRRTSMTDRLGRITRYEYDFTGREIAVIYPDSTPNNLSDNPRTRTDFDLAGQVTKKIDELGNAITYQYDAVGNQIAITNALNETWSMEYDPNNRRAATQDPLGNKSRSIFDGVGNVVQQILPDGSQFMFAYDGQGRLTTQVDAEGAKTDYRYDAYGALIEVIDPLGHHTRYERNERGQATAIVDAEGRRTEFQFDKANRQIARKLPDGSLERFFYDAAGQMTSMVDFMGRATSYSYDVNGRQTRQQFADGRVNESEYNSVGKVIASREGESVTRFTFDERDRLTRKLDPDGLSIEYTYDGAGNLLGSDSIAGATTYSYNLANRLLSVSSGNNVTRYVYDSAGRQIQIHYGNGTLERRDYDPNNRVVRQTLTGPLGTVDELRTTYDRVGRKVSIAEQSGRNERYIFDPAGRLIRNSVDEVTGPDRITTWNYDAVGNRLLREDSILGVTAYQYDVRDRLQVETTGSNSTRYLYDANGNVLSQFDGTKRIENTWDAANRLIESKVTDGTTVIRVRQNYSPDGERYERIENGQTSRILIDTNREHSVVAAELVNGIVRIRYLRPPTGEAAIALIRDGQTSTIFATPMGTTRLVTNASGIVTDRVVIDPFGAVLSRTGTTLGLPIYNGEFRDAVTGYDYLRARFYSPQMGRFVSMDSFFGWHDVPISLNKYVYAHSDPINRRDPTGKFSLAEQLQVASITGTLGGVVGGVIAKANNKSVFRGVVAGFTVGFSIGFTFARLSPGITVLAGENLVTNTAIIGNSLAEVAASNFALLQGVLAANYVAIFLSLGAGGATLGADLLLFTALDILGYTLDEIHGVHTKSPR